MTIAYWRDEYCTGYQEIDNQHKHLFRLINSLHNAMLAEYSDKDLLKILEQLCRFTMAHLKTEEDLMRAVNYSGYAEHKREHQRLKEDMQMLLSENQTSKRFLSIKVSQFLAAWLLHDIQGQDLKMIKALKTMKTSDLHSGQKSRELACA